MPAEFDPHKLFVEGKLWYDLLIALVTGVGTGYFVDFLIRRREESRLRPARSFMRAELMSILDYLFTEMLPVHLVKTEASTARFGYGAVASNPAHWRDLNALGSLGSSDPNLSKRIVHALLQQNSPEPNEAKILREAKRRLEEFLGRHAVIIELEFIPLVGEVCQRLFIALEILDLDHVRYDEWGSGETAQRFADAIIFALQAAERVRLKLNSHVIR
jgi:hypothetical protein